jgi:predicted CoA-binding protein
MEYDSPRVNSSNEEIIEIFKNTKTIAIAGLSPNEEKASNRVARYLQNAGFKIVPIYPKEDTILGEKVYRSLEEIPFKIDMVDVFRKSNAIAAVIDACIARGDIDTVWTQLGLVNNEAALKASEAGMKVVQDKCTKIEHANFF